jgi:hypothetical protein
MSMFDVGEAMSVNPHPTVVVATAITTRPTIIALTYRLMSVLQSFGVSSTIVALGALL